MTRRWSIVTGLSLLLSLVAWPATGQIFRYMAFGDSITRGRLDFDPTGQGGYPGRIDNLLSCFPPNCEVINEGKDGERTTQGVTRIENLLNHNPWDVVLLMEGSNDVFVNVSNNTIEANLTLMDSKARDHGVDTLHASIIHFDPDSTGGMNANKVAAVANMRQRVIALAASRNRYFADPWTRLCPNQGCFDAHYHNPGAGDPNTVGHPDPSGFDIMADEFRDAIVSRPLPGLPTAIAPTGTVGVSNPAFIWNKESPADATWYQARVLNSVQVVIRDDWYEENAICSGSQCTLDLGFFADDDYTWELRGRNPRGRSAWVSTPFTVLTLLPPTLPTPLAPIGLTSDLEPTFEWQREVPSTAVSYRLEVSDTGGVILDTVLSVKGNCNLSTCTTDPFAGAPLAPGVYSWRLRGENAAGPGPWTSLVVFEVDPTRIFRDGFESGDLSAWSSSVL